VRSTSTLLAFLGLASLVLGQGTSRISTANGGIQANNRSGSPAISADGRWVAFQSQAANLVADDTNGKLDIFLHDHMTGQTIRVSVGTGGIQSSDDAYAPAVSGEGRYVAFVSRGKNLVPDDNKYLDVYVRDVQAGSTARVSVTAGGGKSDGDSLSPAISADGRYVAFQSETTNLVSGDTNGATDIFVKDRQTGAISRVSVSSSAAQGNGSSWSPAISADGRYVAFCSGASNLVTGDTNDCWDVFIRDRQGGTTSRVSVSSAGAQADADSGGPALSGDGRFVAFASRAGNLATSASNVSQDVFLHDRTTGQTTAVSLGRNGLEGKGDSSGPRLSTDGRYVAFQSWADNLVVDDANGYWDVFVLDRQGGVLSRASRNSAGEPGDKDSEIPALSGDGRTVAFASRATNLVAGDTNAAADVFVHLLGTTGRPGDLDHDGDADALDLAILAGYLAGGTLPGGTLAGEADVNGDTQVGAADLSHLFQVVVGNL
jgi:Tol biopolymer transport system component